MTLSAYRAFPDDQLAPSGFREKLSNFCVPRAVSFKLCFPEIAPRIGQAEETAIMTVPETAVNKHRAVIRRKYQIGLSRNAGGMQPVAKTFFVQCGPYSQLRARITSPDPRHHPAARRDVNYIRHVLPVSLSKSPAFRRCSGACVSLPP